MSVAAAKHGQPRRALELAQQRRRRRAVLNEAVRGRAIFVDQVLVHPRAHGATLEVLQLLSWPRYFGPKRARAVLRRVGVDEGARLRDLSLGQREAIVEDLRRHHPYVLEVAA